MTCSGSLLLFVLVGVFSFSPENVLSLTSFDFENEFYIMIKEPEHGRTEPIEGNLMTFEEMTPLQKSSKLFRIGVFF